MNIEGPSDPLETETDIIAKNPFDRPDKPGKPTPTDWDKDHVDLEWTPPLSDGGSPIENYLIEKRSKYGRLVCDIYFHIIILNSDGNLQSKSMAARQKLQYPI